VPQLENIPWWDKSILRGEGQAYTKYNQINNNSENFRVEIADRGGLSSPLVTGLASVLKINKVMVKTEKGHGNRVIVVEFWSKFYQTLARTVNSKPRPDFLYFAMHYNGPDTD